MRWTRIRPKRTLRWQSSARTSTRNATKRPSRSSHVPSNWTRTTPTHTACGGLSNFFQAEYAESRRLSRESLLRDPLVPQANLNMARVLVQLKRLDEARSYIDRAIEMQPDAGNYQWAASIMSNAGLPVEAMRYYVESLRQDDTYTRPLVWGGAVLGGLGAYEAADAWLARARQIAPPASGVLPQPDRSPVQASQGRRGIGSSPRVAEQRPGRQPRRTLRSIGPRDDGNARKGT